MLVRIASRVRLLGPTTVRATTFRTLAAKAGSAAKGGDRETRPQEGSIVAQPPPGVMSKLYEPTLFGVPNNFTMRTLLKAGVQYGHRKGTRCVEAKGYVAGVREGIYQIDLEQTIVHLRRALTVVREVAYGGGIVLFVGTRPNTEKIIMDAAMSAGEYHITRKWVPGTLTNIKQTMETTVMPDVIIFLSLPRTQTAVAEAKLARVPSIGIVDSDCNPDDVTYPIPGNDDSPVAIQLYCNLFVAAIREGKMKRKLGISSTMNMLPNAQDGSGQGQQSNRKRSLRGIDKGN
eukprot:Clim_evm63s210 gene=Clim_evmTU63s210